MLWQLIVTTAMLLATVTVALSATSASIAAEGGCVKKTEKAQLWLILLIVVPTALNLVSMLLIGATIWQVRRLKRISVAITSSVHWLTRTAVRVSIGPSAKKALMKYASDKPELYKLVGDMTSAFTDAANMSKNQKAQ